jgi:hypothetical protein
MNINWNELPSDEKLLIVKSDLYAYLSRNSEYWTNEGFLKKDYTYDENGKRQTIYSVTKKAFDTLGGSFTKKVKIRLFNSSLREKIKRANKRDYNLLDLMGA